MKEIREWGVWGVWGVWGDGGRKRIYTSHTSYTSHTLNAPIPNPQSPFPPIKLENLIIKSTIAGKHP
jgi:hypothetical protein